jgi:O-antigen/teichoic acid export membrane protein
MTIEALESGSLTSRAFLLMMARTLSFAFSFALPLLLVRRLSQEDLGLYRQVFLIVVSAINVLPMGFHMSAFYFLPREHGARRGQVALNITLFFALIAALAALALYLRPNLLVAVFQSARFVPLAPLISLVLFLWVATSHLEYLALANEEVRVAIGLIVTLQLTRTLLMLSAALAFGTVDGLLWAALAQGVLQALALGFYLQVRFRAFASRFEFALLRRQLSYSMPLGLAGLLYSMQLDVHNYFVSHAFGVATFAIYSIGCFDLPLVHILSDSVGSVMIPRVNVLQKENRPREIVVLTARMMRKLALVYFAAYALLLVAGREFIVVLFTEKYLASWPIFAINLTMILIYFMTNIYDPVMRAYAEHRFFLLRLRVVLLAGLLVALWFGTARLGLVGVITLVVCVNLVERVLALAKAARIVDVHTKDIGLFKDVGKLAGAAAAAGAAAWIVRALLGGVHPFVILVACGCVFVCVYAAAIWLFKIVTPDERAAAAHKLAGLLRVGRWRRAPQPMI